jgi:hypothetical protein
LAKADPKNTRNVATIQTPAGEAVDSKRSRTLISAEDVESVFNDDCISRLAKLSGLDNYISRLTERSGLDPGDYKSRFGKGIRDAVQIYLRDAAMPNENDVHSEIARLHQAAHFRRYEESFKLVKNLSAQALSLLNRRNLPDTALLLDPSPLTDPARQRRASEKLAALCRTGAKLKKGRKRPGDPPERENEDPRETFAPDLYAPPASRHFEKRAAERTFLMWLHIAWLEATGERQRAHTAARTPDILGPFAKFVCECLKLVGAEDVDGVALINEVKERNFNEACMRMPYGLGWDFSEIPPDGLGWDLPEVPPDPPVN